MEDIITIHQLTGRLVAELKKGGFSETTIWRCYMPHVGTIENYYEKTNQLKYLSVMHADERMHSETYLFFTRHKGQKAQMCDDTARFRIQRHVTTAKEKCPDVPDNPHPHMWRHTRAMHLYQHGMDLERISQWLGHNQLETTLIYAHADTEDKRKAIEAALGGGVTGELRDAPYTVDDEEILKKLYGL